MFPWNSETPAENVKTGKQIRQQTQLTSTCPWADAIGEVGSRSSSESRRHQPQQTNNTCPWGDVGSEMSGSRSSSRSRRSKTSSPNTCPWGESGAADSDTAHLARCEQLRQRPPIQYSGCAGSGAPRREPFQQDSVQQDTFAAQQDMRTSSFASSGYLPPLPPRAPSRERNSPAAQQGMRMPPGSTGYIPTRASSRERNSSTVPAEQDVARGQPVASELEYDPDAQERADLITKCLAAGLTDEEIEGVLREHMFQKMVEQEQKKRAAAPPLAAAALAAAEKPAPSGYQPRNSAQAPSTSSLASRIIANSQDHLSEEYRKELQTASKEAPPPECTFEPPKPSSVAAKRKARAASFKSVSFGPSDEEIAGILEDHGTGRTPSPSMDKQVGLAGVNFTSAAYLQSQKQAAEAKNKNRNGSIIF